MDLAALRRAYAGEVVRSAGVAGAMAARLVAAFAAVPRERFAGPPPWRILDAEAFGPRHSDDPAALYRDVLVSLDVERGINNGQPSLHAQCLAAAAVAPGETVLHVGAGGGYYSAVLAELVGYAGRVEAYEIEPTLAQAARAALEPWPQAMVHAASALDAALPACDVIYVNAGASHPPAPWLDALAPGGRLVLPLTGEDKTGVMLRVERRGLQREAYAASLFARVSFIPLVGAREASQAARLEQALRLRPTGAVRSLQRGREPDASAWCVGEGWWLSSAEPPAAG